MTPTPEEFEELLESLIMGGGEKARKAAYEAYAELTAKLAAAEAERARLKEFISKFPFLDFVDDYPAPLPPQEQKTGNSHPTGLEEMPYPYADDPQPPAQAGEVGE
jgi:hypothetical protein